MARSAMRVRATAADGRARAWLKSAMADRRGAAFVEFAFIAPVLLLMALAMSDLSPAIMGEFHVDHANESTGDMASAYTQMQNSDMVNVLAVASDVLEPLPTTASNPEIRVTSVYTDGKGHAKVYWSCGLGLTPYTANTAVTSTPTGAAINSLLATTLAGAANTTYIMSEISYSYQPVANYVLTHPITMTNTAYLLPRESNYVGFPWDGLSTDSPPVPTSTTTNASSTLSDGATCSYAK